MAILDFQKAGDPIKVLADGVHYLINSATGAITHNGAPVTDQKIQKSVIAAFDKGVMESAKDAKIEFEVISRLRAAVAKLQEGQHNLPEAGTLFTAVRQAEETLTGSEAEKIKKLGAIFAEHPLAENLLNETAHTIYNDQAQINKAAVQSFAKRVSTLANRLYELTEKPVASDIVRKELETHGIDLFEHLPDDLKNFSQESITTKAAGTVEAFTMEALKEEIDTKVDGITKAVNESYTKISEAVGDLNKRGRVGAEAKKTIADELASIEKLRAENPNYGRVFNQALEDHPQYDVLKKLDALKSHVASVGKGTAEAAAKEGRSWFTRTFDFTRSESYMKEQLAHEKNAGKTLAALEGELGKIGSIRYGKVGVAVLAGIGAVLGAKAIFGGGRDEEQRGFAAREEERRNAAAMAAAQGRA